MSFQELRFEDARLAWMFLVVAALVVGVVFFFQWRAALMRRLGDAPLIRRLVSDVSVVRQWIRWGLILLSAVLIVTALLRPQYGTREARLPNRGIDIVLAVDLSKSMLVRDVAPNRLKAATAMLKEVVGRLTGGRVALVPFAGIAYTQSPLTTDRSALSSYLDDLRVEDMPVGGTRIGAAIRHCLSLLEPPADGDEDVLDADAPRGSHYKAIVLVTDGEDHDEGAADAAAAAKAANARVFTVGIGSTSSTFKIPVLDDEGKRTGWVYDKGQQALFSHLNTVLLEATAAAGGGASFVYGKDDVVAGLAAALDALEKREYEHHYQNLHEDRFQFALLPALLLLLVETLIGDRRRKRRGVA